MSPELRNGNHRKRHNSAKLIDERGLSYRDVMRKIGSQTPVVARNYIAHCIFLQMEETEDLYVSAVRDRFSLLFLSLRSRHVQRFLGVEQKFHVSPQEVKPPGDDHIDRLRQFCLWLFGDKETDPVVKDSRQIDKFAVVLSSSDGLDYLRRVHATLKRHMLSLAAKAKKSTIILLMLLTASTRPCRRFIYTETTPTSAKLHSGS